jgi:hypothetical protein
MKDREYENARKKIKAQKEFYKHLTIYVVMSVFFFLLNASTSFGHWWFQWPVLGWGMGVVFHYFDVFGFPGAGDIPQEWEEGTGRRKRDRMDRGEIKRIPQPGQRDDEDSLELRELEKKEKKWNDDELV